MVNTHCWECIDFHENAWSRESVDAYILKPPVVAQQTGDGDGDDDDNAGTLDPYIS